MELKHYFVEDEKHKEALKEVLSTIAERPALYVGKNRFFDSSPFNYVASPVLEKIENTVSKLVDKPERTYESIIPIISRMIPESFDDLWVYLHYERYFLCIRFLYHNEKADWVENTDLSYRDDYFHNLLVLHAYATFVQKEERPSHILTLRHHKNMTTIIEELVTDVWFDILNKPDANTSAYDENPFYISYSKWTKGGVPVKKTH